eukprot:GHVQ01016746.1.p1 GENE.GHVQ01016746.1~~GHVQ01016746.1.p1  ORF type:complete len:597 (+),score=126.08 GHVQ01016746.1:434-2224(+)
MIVREGSTGSPSMHISHLLDAPPSVYPSPSVLPSCIPVSLCVPRNVAPQQSQPHTSTQDDTGPTYDPLDNLCDRENHGYYRNGCRGYSYSSTRGPNRMEQYSRSDVILNSRNMPSMCIYWEEPSMYGNYNNNNIKHNTMLGYTESSYTTDKVTHSRLSSPPYYTTRDTSDNSNVIYPLHNYKQFLHTSLSSTAPSNPSVSSSVCEPSLSWSVPPSTDAFVPSFLPSVFSKTETDRLGQVTHCSVLDGHKRGGDILSIKADCGSENNRECSSGRDYRRNNSCSSNRRNTSYCNNSSWSRNSYTSRSNYYGNNSSCNSSIRCSNSSWNKGSRSHVSQDNYNSRYNDLFNSSNIGKEENDECMLSSLLSLVDINCTRPFNNPSILYSPSSHTASASIADCNNLIEQTLGLSQHEHHQFLQHQQPSPQRILLQHEQEHQHQTQQLQQQQLQGHQQQEQIKNYIPSPRDTTRQQSHHHKHQSPVPLQHTHPISFTPTHHTTESYSPPTLTTPLIHNLSTINNHPSVTSHAHPSSPRWSSSHITQQKASSVSPHLILLLSALLLFLIFSGLFMSVSVLFSWSYPLNSQHCLHTHQHRYAHLC